MPGRAAGNEKKKEPTRRNITDPDSRLMPVRGGGFIQGYNAQNVTSEDGLIIATRLTSDTPWREPRDAGRRGRRRDSSGPGTGQAGLVPADVGYR